MMKNKIRNNQEKKSPYEYWKEKYVEPDTFILAAWFT